MEMGNRKGCKSTRLVRSDSEVVSSADLRRVAYRFVSCDVVRKVHSESSPLCNLKDMLNYVHLCFDSLSGASVRCFPVGLIHLLA
jgi:hypothetical protein